MEEHQKTQSDKDMSNYNKVLYNGECWATMTTAIAASSAYSINEQYYNIPINPLSKTTSESEIWLIISLAHILITKLMKVPVPEPMYENCRWINQNMQELVTVWACTSVAAMWDSCVTWCDSTVTLQPTFAAGTLSHPGKRGQYLPVVFILGVTFLGYVYIHSLM